MLLRALALAALLLPLAPKPPLPDGLTFNPDGKLQLPANYRDGVLPDLRP